MSEKATMFELKEKAKWSRSTEEKKTAISEISNFGQDAIPPLEEILHVTAYADIKEACLEAIKAIQTGMKQDRENIAVSKDSTNPPATASKTVETKNQKKEEIQRQDESDAKREVSLADLPP